MSIITLTTDLGTKDHYSGALKGTLLSHSPQVNLIDVTHEVSHFNIIEAAFVLKGCYDKFPEGTVHLICVDPEGGGDSAGVMMLLDGHYFVAADNGVLSLIRERNLAPVLKIDEDKMNVGRTGKAFRAMSLLAPAAAHLAEGRGMEEIGTEHHMREVLWGEPVYTDNSLRGTIVFIDHFGNAITNITKEEFLRVRADRSFTIYVRNKRFTRIVSSYRDVSKGEGLALFSENGHLEIALREGSAAQLLGLKEQDMLTVEFKS